MTALVVIITDIGTLGLSQPSTVWLTYQVVAPTSAVEGTGTVAEPVPPVAVVYHNRPVPVADNGKDGAFLQYCTGLTTVGAGGIGITVTTSFMESLQLKASVPTIL